MTAIPPRTPAELDRAELQGVSTERAPHLVAGALVAEVNHGSAVHRNPQVAADADRGHRDDTFGVEAVVVGFAWRQFEAASGNCG